MSIKNAIDTIYEPIIEDLERVQRNIRKELETSNQLVNRVINYIFGKKGKLLRPAMALLAGRAVAVERGEAIDEMLMHLATAVELIHNASLVHDDILDGSSIRRDLPTLNSTYNNHIALLAGDALFSQAFYIMAHNMERRVIVPITLVTAGMCQGEIINAVNEGGSIDFSTYLAIVKLKTASLMSVSTQTGAMVVGADEKTVQIMADYGMSMGIAYQMIDDYVDEEIGQVKGYSLDYALKSAEKARKVLRPLKSSIYKSKLLQMLDLVREMSAQKNMSTAVRMPWKV
jgi:octaprenyl-diphosphate synthase